MSTHQEPYSMRELSLLGDEKTPTQEPLLPTPFTDSHEFFAEWDSESKSGQVVLSKDVRTLERELATLTARLSERETGELATAKLSAAESTIEGLKGERDEALAGVVELEHARNSVEALGQEVESLKQQNTTLSKSLAAMRDAIKPFCFGMDDEMTASPLFHDLHEDTVIYSNYGHHISAGDFRKLMDSRAPSAGQSFVTASEIPSSAWSVVRVNEGIMTQPEIMSIHK